MRPAGVKAWSHLDPAVFSEIPVQLKTSLVSGAGSFRERRGRIIRNIFAGLNDADLCTNSAVLGEPEILFEADLRNPQPKVPGSGQRGHADPGQRCRLARIEDRLLQPRHHAAALPLNLDGGRTHPE